MSMSFFEGQSSLSDQHSARKPPSIRIGEITPLQVLEIELSGELFFSAIVKHCRLVDTNPHSVAVTRPSSLTEISFMTNRFRWFTDIKSWLGGWYRSSLPNPRRPCRPHLEHLEDRTLPSGGPGVNYTVTDNWGSGVQAQVQLTNNQNTPLTSWQLQFTDPDTITSIWDAQIVSHVGNQYVIAGDSWDNSIAAGGSTSFGFVANVAANSPGPSNFVLTGSNSGGSGGSGSGGSTPSGGLNVNYTVTNNWGSGLQAQVQLTNNQNTNLSNWQLQFTDPDTITSIWDAQIVSHVGNQYVIAGDNWDNSIAAGGSTSFGFVANVAANSPGPSNFVLTGSSSGSSTGGGGSSGGGSSGPTQQPSAANYTIGTSPGQPIEIDASPTTSTPWVTP